MAEQFGEKRWGSMSEAIRTGGAPKPQRTLEEMLKEEFIANQSAGLYAGLSGDDSADISIDGPHTELRAFMREVFLHLDKWAMASPDQFRNCALGTSVKTAFMANPILNLQDAQVRMIRDDILHTVADGRMIDFGHLPNTVIKEVSQRGREPFEAGALTHPFNSWVMVTSWEGGYNGYYICPNPDDPTETMIVELYGVSVPNDMDLLVLYDYCSVRPTPGTTHVRVSETLSAEGNTEAQLKSRSANCLDPVVAGLMLLADASVPVVYKPAPVKLNKARAKAGRVALPASYRVETHDYVTNWGHTYGKGGAKGLGGTHASPVSHWRKAHDRHMASGVVAKVRATKVNWREADEVHRLFYHVGANK